MTRRWLMSIASAVVVMATWGPCAAQQTVKYTGTVLAIDRARGQLVLGEVGPWREGVTQRIRRTITLTGQTEYTIGFRANPPGGFPGEFIEGPLRPGDIEAGDVVTVLCRKDGRRLVALKIVFADTQTLESEGGLQLELKRQRTIVAPRPSAEETARDLDEARRATERQRAEQLLKGAEGTRRPDLEESAVGGVQSQGIQRALPKK